MLRSVRFKNFVRYKEYQMMDFSSDGPFIFIGENGSGKSSVLEGIRRCLKLEKSTSVSSVPEPNEISYFICNADTNISGNEEEIIFGMVSFPLPTQQNKGAKLETENYNAEKVMDLERIPNIPEGRQAETRKRSVDEELPIHRPKRQRSLNTEFTNFGISRNMEGNSTTASSSSAWGSNQAPDSKVVTGNESEVTNVNNNMHYYKFAMKRSEGNDMFIDLIGSTKTDDGQTYLVSKRYKVSWANLSEEHQLLFDKIDIEDCIRRIFGNLDEVASHVSTTQLETILQDLTEQFVFTFPLRSIGPLQWSESNRISYSHRKENYEEAEKRCEIIKYFLNDKRGKKFDKDKEEKCFKELSQSEDYKFELKDGKVQLQNGKSALLKTPEGILEAKAFSILISSKQYKTIVLEEPDRGMHPQFVERMMLLMKQERNKKRVILTTHQKGVITPWTLLDTFVFKRCNTENRIIFGKYICGAEMNGSSVKKTRLVTSQHIQDILFASKVLFYEGDSEELFLTELKCQAVSEGHSFASKLMKYTFINMKSKDNRKTYRTVSDNLKLDYLFLVDRDAVPGILGKTEKKEVKEMNKYLKLEENSKATRANLLKDEKTFFWLHGAIEEMVTTMCDKYSDLKKELQDLNVISKKDGPSKIAGEKTKRKLFLNEKVHSHHVTKSISHILKRYEEDDDLAEFIKILTETTEA